MWWWTESYWTVSELAWLSCPPRQDTLLLAVTMHLPVLRCITRVSLPKTQPQKVHRWQVKMFMDKQTGQDTIDAYQAALDEHVAGCCQA